MKLWEANCQDEMKAGTKNLNETPVLLRSRTEWRKGGWKRTNCKNLKKRAQDTAVVMKKKRWKRGEKMWERKMPKGKSNRGPDKA